MRSHGSTHARLAALVAAFALTAFEVRAGAADDDTDQKIDKALKVLSMFSFETLWYLHYAYAKVPVDESRPALGYETENAFRVTRGHLTVKVRPVDWFGAAVTADTTQDGDGDMKVRLKYLYGIFTAPMETRFITEPSLEFGLEPMPWIGFEEQINWYRAQGSMFMERNGLFNSSDFGVTLSALLGRKLDAPAREVTSPKYPGTWGSLSLGLYNGGGYTAFEKNAAKSFEGRLTVRPAGGYFPYLQASYFGIIGRGNVEKGEDWNPPIWWQHAAMLSFEHRYVTATAQFVTGKGNQRGSYLDWATEVDPLTGDEIIVGIDKVHEYMGASGFLELSLPWIISSVIGRYDWFRREDVDRQRIIVGYALHFYGFRRNFILIDFDYAIPDKNVEGIEETWEVKVTLQIKL
jgi:hypothetical protein